MDGSGGGWIICFVISITGVNRLWSYETAGSFCPGDLFTLNFLFIPCIYDIPDIQANYVALCPHAVPGSDHWSWESDDQD